MSKPNVVSQLRSSLTSKKEQKKNFNPWMITSLFLALGLIGSLLYYSGDISASEVEEIAPNEAREKLLSFLNEAYKDTAGEARPNGDVAEVNGIYKIPIILSGQNGDIETDIYTTVDGVLFIPDARDIAKSKEEIEKAKNENNQANSENSAKLANIPKLEKPKVELFTMSYCPFGNQAEDGISPVARLLADKVNIEPHYVIYSNYRGGGPNYCLDEDNKYCSMHGVGELKQNIRELCIYKYEKNKFWDYIDAVNKECDLNNIDNCWSKPAEKLGINTKKIETCFDQEAFEMLAKEVELNEKYEVRGSPTTIINGVAYSGGRAPESYKQGICGAFENSPKECETILDSAGATASGGCG